MKPNLPPAWCDLIVGIDLHGLVESQVEHDSNASVSDSERLKSKDRA